MLHVMMAPAATSLRSGNHWSAQVNCPAETADGVMLLDPEIRGDREPATHQSIDMPWDLEGLLDHAERLRTGRLSNASTSASSMASAVRARDAMTRWESEQYLRGLPRAWLGSSFEHPEKEHVAMN